MPLFRHGDCSAHPDRSMCVAGQILSGVGFIILGVFEAHHSDD